MIYLQLLYIFFHNTLIFSSCISKLAHCNSFLDLCDGLQYIHWFDKLFIFSHCSTNKKYFKCFTKLVIPEVYPTYAELMQSGRCFRALNSYSEIEWLQTLPISRLKMHNLFLDFCPISAKIEEWPLMSNTVWPAAWGLWWTDSKLPDSRCCNSYTLIILFTSALKDWL